MKENATIITRYNHEVNFGQTGVILDFNEFSDVVVFQPHGDRNKYILHYTEVWLQKNAYQYEKLNKALAYLDKVSAKSKNKL